MRQDRNPVPHPRASCEQISHQRDQDQQAPARQAEDRQPPVRRAPAWRPPDQQPSSQPTSYRQAPPIYDTAPNDPGVGFATPWSEPLRFPSPWHQDAGPAHANGWQGMPKPQHGDQETEATLASVREAQRKAKRMQAVCVLLGACAAAIFLLAAVSHQLDGHIEMMTPVLLLTSSVNFRRYAQRVAKYRSAEADLVARVR